MKQILITIFFSLLLFNKGFACLNGEIMILKDGTYVFEDREGNVPYGHNFSRKGNLERGVAQIDSVYKATKDLDYLSDKGLLLILLERYDEAIKLYLEIEKLEPNRYSTASNIGTAYELLGQNEQALFWIKKAIDIDPSSHKNSEWIHVKILEVKIKGEQFCTTNFMLNTAFGSEILPHSQMTKKQLQELSDALYYQLNERVSFVRPKDKIVAQLLFDLGNIAFLLGNYDDASADYKQAKLYGYEGELIEQRLQESITNRQNLRKQKEHSTSNAGKRSYIFGILGGILLIALITIVYRRGMMRNRDRG